MPIPTYHEMCRPFLDALKDGKTRSKREIIEFIAYHFQLTEEDMAKRYQRSKGRVVYHRASWACLELKKAGLIESHNSAMYKITESGLEALKNGPDVITRKYLSRFNDSSNFHDASPVEDDLGDDESKTPDEAIEEAFGEINSRLADEILSEVAKLPPQEFEQLTVDLLQKMGYGDFEKSSQVTSPSHDGGIDGIIKEDRLGFSLIYIQAKKWDASSTVGQPDLQKFGGAIPDHGKGVFITTARFSEGAKAYAKNRHIILIDGDKLAELMIEYNFGARVNQVYEIKSVDTDFFDGYTGG